MSTKHEHEHDHHDHHHHNECGRGHDHHDHDHCHDDGRGSRARARRRGKQKGILDQGYNRGHFLYCGLHYQRGIYTARFAEICRNGMLCGFLSCCWL